MIYNCFVFTLLSLYFKAYNPATVVCVHITQDLHGLDAIWVYGIPATQNFTLILKLLAAPGSCERRECRRDQSNATASS